jgi:PAS domain-containing protein
VCADCGLGLLLEARTDAIPRLNEAFLVVDHSLTVAGLSREAETLLGVAETDAVHRPLTELLVPADAEALGPENLAVAVTWAARGEDEETRTVHVRPTNVFGVRFTARIAPCGPPRAALVVLAD